MALSCSSTKPSSSSTTASFRTAAAKHGASLRERVGHAELQDRRVGKCLADILVGDAVGDEAHIARAGLDLVEHGGLGIFAELREPLSTTRWRFFALAGSMTYFGTSRARSRSLTAMGCVVSTTLLQWEMRVVVEG